ncbi:MAG TPA: aldo/keto reductase [Kofleriaceae bacterium]|nr:aldo/keto reductase [Kofleriaceae bacterium]
MRRRRFGPLEVEVPVIGIGTWNMEGDDAKEAIAAIRAALDHGATHVDTAELYGSGRVEELVGRAIAGRRDEVFLVSKVMPRNASRAGTVKACERSLRRLGTDHLDVYLLHWRGDEPLAETIAGFEELRAAGKIRAWGVSNFDADDLDEALAIAGPGRIACNQVLYHLRERAIEHRVLPWCEAHEVAVVAYSPFGSGNFPRGVSHAEALAFLTRRASVFAIPKTSHAARAAENAAAGDLVLDDAAIRRLDAAFPLGKARGLPMI